MNKKNKAYWLAAMITSSLLFIVCIFEEINLIASIKEQGSLLLDEKNFLIPAIILLGVMIVVLGLCIALSYKKIYFNRNSKNEEN